MNDHDRWLESADLYALGALDGAEKTEFESHLSGRCAACLKRVADAEGALGEAAAAALAPVAPPAALRGRVLASVGVRAGAGALAWTGAAAAACVAGLALFAVLREPVVSAPSQVAKLEAGMAAHAPEFTDILSEKEVRLVRVQGEGLEGKLVWNPRVCGGCFRMSGLKAPGDGRVFQLWAIRDGQAPVSVGTFSPDREGEVHADFPELIRKDAYGTFAVTVEPAGGMPQPTGPIRFSGSF